MQVRYIGVARSGKANSQILVQSAQGKFYVASCMTKNVSSIQEQKVLDLPVDALELATEEQVKAGREAKPHLPALTLDVEYFGLVSRGKTNCRILVTSNGKHYTLVATAEDILGLQPGALVRVEYRRLETARKDQIAAGLGLGRLQRKPRQKKAATA